MAPLKLCILSSEIMPFAKTGGLADAVGGMVRELAQRDHDVRAFMPLYASVKRVCGDLKTVPGLQGVGIIIGTRVYAFSVRTASIPGTRIPMYFIDCPELYDRPSLYRSEEHTSELQSL